MSKAIYYFKLIFLLTIFFDVIYLNDSKKLHAANNSMNTYIYQAIVIGGGVAGLATCKYLINNGINNILLVEASPRLGGRINTVNLDHGHIELGAQWVHGTKNNPVYEILNSLHQIDKDTTFYTNETIYRASQDGKLQNETLVGYIEAEIEKMVDDLVDNLSHRYAESQSLGNLLESNFYDKIIRKQKNHFNFDYYLMKAIYRSKLEDQCADFGVNNFYELSANGFSDYDEFDGDHFNNLKNGFYKFIEYLYSRLPASVVKLNEAVEKIDWSAVSENSNNNGILYVNTLNSLNKHRATYLTNFVVSSVSLGVLKQNHKSLFNPPLPADKVNIIERLGFGTVNKLFLVFERPVFNGNQQGLELLWKEDLNFYLNAANKWNIQGTQFYKSLHTFTVLPKQKNVLFGFLSGNDSIYSESLSDDCMIDVIHEILIKFFPSLRLPRPIKILRSKWNSSPFERGSYSFIKLGSTMEDVINLAKPVNKRLFFVGEATSTFLGTVHGAFMSGRDAAYQIASSWKG